MRLRALSVCLALTFVAMPAHPQTPPQSIYSKAFYGDSSGAYINTDPKTGCSLTNNCNVSLNGGDALPILVNPWEPVSINILCVQVIFAPQGTVTPQTYAFAGNSYSPDIMMWTMPRAGGGADGKICYPPGTAFPFPAAATGAPANAPGQNNFTQPHLDVHVNGQGALVNGTPSTVNYQVWLQVWYTKNAR